MLFLLGLFTVIGSVILGYTMHHGDLRLLWQPNEFIIILGAAIGASLASNPLDVVKSILKSFSYLFKGHPYSKKDYLELLLLLFNLTKAMKVKGMLEIENHVEHPEESPLFAEAQSVMRNKHSLEFIRDNLRLLIMGVDDPHNFEFMIDAEIDTMSHHYKAPGKALLSLGDSLPALGIVAAVLGVIVTMRSIVEPPEVLGGLIAAALVGTFLGVLLSYGCFIPIGHFVSTYGEHQIAYLNSIKSAFIGYLNGNPPVVITEFVRKSIPRGVQPSFSETELMISTSTQK